MRAHESSNTATGKPEIPWNALICRSYGCSARVGPPGGRTSREVCEVTGYSPGWVRQIARRYNEWGVEGLGDRRHSNPGAKKRALLDGEGEAELLEALSGSPPGGGMWSGPKVARWIAQRNGLEKVHVQRGFEYLRKVGYTPQVPRPSNARADASEREAFKKVLR